MGIFRRSLSSSSSQTRTSTTETMTDTTISRTSLGSDSDKELSCSLATITRAPAASLLHLPIELIQQISKYLDTASSASFCLSSRYIYYALGTAVLSKYLESGASRFEKRRTIEAVVERAFPGHFFCAWCDKFHAWNTGDGPTAISSEKKRDCADFNSYLYSFSSYTLCYHHVRLAINRSLWGPEHGIPLSAFSHTKSSTARIFKTPVPTKLQISARIKDARFLLHTSFAIILPTWSTTNKNLLKHLWQILPHILSGHRDSEHGHTGLMAAIDNVVRRGWKYPFTQMCSTCATDWSVACHAFPHSSGAQVRLVVQSWRDLGAGRNPFETGWRSHGVCVPGREMGSMQVFRLTGYRAGDVSEAFERAGVEEEGGLKRSAVGEGKRNRSTSRARIYRSFMRRESGDVYTEDGDGEVRRSRARPRTWRTRSEHAEIEREEEQERIEMAQRVAEVLVRLEAERGC